MKTSGKFAWAAKLTSSREASFSGQPKLFSGQFGLRPPVSDSMDSVEQECKPVEGTQYFYGGFKDSKSDSDPETES
eukprot:3282286-Rhodomonas_salina.1